jgi:4-hydroxybenzoate polyprenyltransferase
MSQDLLVSNANDHASRSSGTSSIDTPLVVDLDGSLIRTDLLYESFFAALPNGFKHHYSVMASLLRGKAHLKAYLAQVAVLDHALLPYNPAVVDLIVRARKDGRRIYLATASDRRHAEVVAEHLGHFDGIFASDGETNLSGEAKARRLIEAFGDKNFDYVGNEDRDVPIWAHARKAYIVGGSRALLRKVQALDIAIESIDNPRTPVLVWLKALRAHQYVKNVLVFVPLLTAHAYAPHFVVNALLAFVAFSLCASSVYLLNDLVDLDADRRHPTKRKRPFASGAIPLAHGVIAIPLLLILSFSCAAAVSLNLVGVLSAYFGLSLSYSLSLKRKLMVDVVVLAMLYTTRVIAGAVALPVVPSEWLLAFSMFIFTSLALVKRYVELAMRIDKELPDPRNRNYRLADLPIVGALAAASGLNAVTIFTLYISSSTVRELYRHPEVLWLICPVLLYWLARVVVLAHRRAIDDDPIVFAIHDRNSRICGVLMVLIVLAAS